MDFYRSGRYSIADATRDLAKTHGGDLNEGISRVFNEHKYWKLEKKVGELGGLIEHELEKLAGDGRTTRRNYGRKAHLLIPIHSRLLRAMNSRAWENAKGADAMRDYLDNMSKNIDNLFKLSRGAGVYEFDRKTQQNGAAKPVIRLGGLRRAASWAIGVGLAYALARTAYAPVIMDNDSGNDTSIGYVADDINDSTRTSGGDLTGRFSFSNWVSGIDLSPITERVSDISDGLTIGLDEAREYVGDFFGEVYGSLNGIVHTVGDFNYSSPEDTGLGEQEEPLKEIELVLDETGRDRLGFGTLDGMFGENEREEKTALGDLVGLHRMLDNLRANGHFLDINKNRQRDSYGLDNAILDEIDKLPNGEEKVEPNIEEEPIRQDISELDRERSIRQSIEESRKRLSESLRKRLGLKEYTSFDDVSDRQDGVDFSWDYDTLSEEDREFVDKLREQEESSRGIRELAKEKGYTLPSNELNIGKLLSNKRKRRELSWVDQRAMVQTNKIVDDNPILNDGGAWILIQPGRNR